MQMIRKFGQAYKVKWWKDEILQPTIAIDTETSLITSPAILPNLILTTVYDGSNDVYIIKNNMLPQFMKIHCHATFYMWNAAFDVSILEQNGVNFDNIVSKRHLIDGQILYRLFNIATEGQEAQKWSLDFVVDKLLQTQLEKNDEIRLTFGQYLDKDMSVQYDSISPFHLDYACLDPIATFLCTKAILRKISNLPTTTNLAHDINLLGDLALAQVTRNGIHIDQGRVNAIKQHLEEEKVKNSTILAEYGYIKGKKGNTKVLTDFCQEKGFILPKTATGKQGVGKSHLEAYKSHPFIDSYVRFKGFSKQQNFLNDLLTPIVHPRYNSIKVTSRTSCTRPNLQQMPRIGGIREVFIPAPGNVFLDCDYSMIELCALSSICLRLFKQSVMADKINENKDLHRYLASKIYKCTEEEVTKEQRQFAKVGNFGFGADMGAETFVTHAGKAGYILTLEEAKQIKNAYLEAYPEMAKYFKRARGRDTLVTDTGFIRANVSYTEYLNCGFQTKAAEGAKLALYDLLKLGYKVAGFIHDQVLIEHPKEGAEEALIKVKEIMIAGMQKVVIGVKVSVEGTICTHFKK